MPISYGIFYERQRGGLCRMHACNAYFEESKLTPQDFYNYQKEFDLIIQKHKSYKNMSCIDWDFCYFFGETLMSYILRKHGSHVRKFSIGQNKNLADIMNCMHGNFIFAFTKSHVFGVVKNKENWFKVDSLTGVSPIKIKQIIEDKCIGFLVPVDQYKEFYSNVEYIKKIVNGKNIINFITDIHNDTKDLGELEVPLTNLMASIRARFLGNKLLHKKKFIPVALKLMQYSNFIKDFEKNLIDLDKKIKIIAPIIKWIVTLNENKEK